MEDATSVTKELGLYDRIVFFRGVKFEEELAREIQNSNFLVMFSNYETFSVVLQEALSCGKPVIATRTGPIPDLIDEDSGILVNPCDERELSNALDFMLDHYQDYDPQRLHNSGLHPLQGCLIGFSDRATLLNPLRGSVINESMRFNNRKRAFIGINSATKHNSNGLCEN